MRSAVVCFIVITSLVLMGCQGYPGSGDSPGTRGGSSTGIQTQAAQTIGGDQGQAETPQTNTSGTASNMFKFASEGVDPGIGLALIEIADKKDWSAEALAGIFKSMNGAPENVDIKIEGGVKAETGANENVGSAGGTGGNAGMRDVENPDNR